MEAAPTLGVEILSPSTTLLDRGRKRASYARYGMPFYWIADDESQAIEMWRGRNG